MSENTENIKNLESQLDDLMRKQALLIDEANRLKVALRSISAAKSSSQPKETPLTTEKPTQEQAAVSGPSHKISESLAEPLEDLKTQESFNLEKFVGENLINKIGILITVIGVAIGAKYSIDRGLVSPLTRIVLGYLMGIGLLGFGMKLKTNYESYSAVLVSGAMTILYFITYLGYSMYGLFSQPVAFVLMLLFTAFTVYAALNYRKQVIAILGLVGAYTVPFLLSTGSGRVDILFSYMVIINIGILIISLKQHWKLLYYLAFIITWLIYLTWYATSSHDLSLTLAFLFLSLFYVIFYATFIGYKLTHQQKFDIAEVSLLLLNSFIFYGCGYALLQSDYAHFLGLFTVLNGIIHFAVCYYLYKLQLAEKSLFYLIAGLVLTFITIAIPVQLDGNWVTLLWISEAAVLFWVGRTKSVKIYEQASYILMTLAGFSLLQDWQWSYKLPLNHKSLATQNFVPIFNISFLNSGLFIAIFSFIYYIHLQKKHWHTSYQKSRSFNLLHYTLPIVLASIFYFSFFLEINQYWDQVHQNTAVQTTTAYFLNADIPHFKSIWLLIYTISLALIASWVCIKKIKNERVATVILGLNAVVSFIFLTSTLFAISELREHYIARADSLYYVHSGFNIGIRYVALLFLGGLVYTSYVLVKQSFMNHKLHKIFDLALHIILIWVLSSELLSIMSLAGLAHNYKLGLSILWGVYALALVAYGIWKNNTYLRIGAIALFAATLVKVFLYDISHLDTIAKTIVFVSLGVLLLIISYLYNRFKNQISYDEKTAD